MDGAWRGTESKFLDHHSSTGNLAMMIPNTKFAHLNNQDGMTLVELLVTLAIG
ncbi:MAG: prepilin-type N-terminal cleavage/methylation domain-containing protein, partial [Woeseia sp.]|nr:prepilin-type N-terminal cleavage/methylation domain-containing protein [Woeseia sp.]